MKRKKRHLKKGVKNILYILIVYMILISMVLFLCWRVEQLDKGEQQQSNNTAEKGVY